MADVAYTLKEGRRAFEKRRVIVAESHDEAARLLEGGAPGLHFYTMNRAGPTLAICQRLGLLQD